MSSFDKDLDTKYRMLQAILKSFKRVIIAYSGGVDSVFLLKAAIESLGTENVLACIGQSESLARSEYETGCALAWGMGAQVEVVYPDELADPDYAANSPSRCFHCKSHLYSLLNELARERNFEVVLCGSNADDCYDFRPGRQAAEKHGVRSPLEQAGLTKEDIRVLSQRFDLPTWDKPAQPCLASRVAYGVAITPDRLKQVEQGEAYLRSLGLRELRVRHHDKLARIEVPADKLGELLTDNRREEIVDHFKKLGFTYVTLDLQGFRSGSGNEALQESGAGPV